MKKFLDYLWPLVGLLAVVASFWLLYHKLGQISAQDVWRDLLNIPAHRWLLAVVATLFAYYALAWYDRIALLHLGRKMDWLFISLVSFTTYAISHNIGASVFSGAMVRYRAYSTRGLTAGQVAILVAFCSFTFALGMILLAGVVLTVEPEMVTRLHEAPIPLIRGVGIVLLALIGLYILGSALHMKPIVFRSFRLEYPRLPVAARQLITGPLEIMGAAAIIYFALPAGEGNPGYFVVLGVFVLSFSFALLSHAPGGIGVLEAAFLTMMPDMAQTDVLAALIVFRLLYLLLPLFFAAFVVIVFERSRFGKAAPPAVPPPAA